MKRMEGTDWALWWLWLWGAATAGVRAEIVKDNAQCLHVVPLQHRCAYRIPAG